MLPLNGSSALKEKRKIVVHNLNLSQDATEIGDWNHTANNTLLLDSDALPHVNNAEDPGSNTLNFNDSATNVMERDRNLTSDLSLSDYAHVCYCGSISSGGDGTALSVTMTAGVVISAGQPLYVSSNNTVSLACADPGSPIPNYLLSQVVGLAKDSASASDDVELITEGVVELNDWSSVVGSANLTAGAVYFLSETEGMLTETAPTTDNTVVTRVGRALTTKKMDIEVGEVVYL